MSNATAAPTFTASNSQPSFPAPTPDGEKIGPWISCGGGLEKRRKVIFQTEFVDYTNRHTGERRQWFNQLQTHFTQCREVGDLTNRIVEADIWRRERADSQGLGIRPL